MKRWTVWVVFPVLVVALAGMSVWGAAMPRAAAQDAGTAEWTISRMDFTSVYPRGFQFVLDAESSGGPIVSARVVWQHRPTNRANEPVRVRRATGEIDMESMIITATWEPSGATNVPPWVAVYYAWELRDEAGNEYVTERQMAEYADASRVWTRLETDDAIIFSEGMVAGAGELVAEALAATRQKYLDGWGGTLPYKPRIILFHDFDTFNEWRINAIDTSGLGYVSVGVTSDAWGARHRCFTARWKNWRMRRCCTRWSICTSMSICIRGARSIRRAGSSKGTRASMRTVPTLTMWNSCAIWQ
ncbi:MAG: hypothetical protein K8S97_01085 [Anaerolineae bacterium]|nr:hypothetical protein [Anaerolineae bacterium]